MKSKTSSRQTKKAGVSLFEIAFTALPFVALIPNTFIAPPLGYEGLATQEFYFACAMVVFAGMGLVRFIRAAGATGAIELDREELLILAALAIFILWQVIFARLGADAL